MPHPPRRIAAIVMHTSPLEQPGVGDAGGLNTYVVQTSKRLAALGVQVDVFTRATSPDQPPTAELAPGVTVRHIVAGPYPNPGKDQLPTRLAAFIEGVSKIDDGRYDLVHSHYWLSGQAGCAVSRQWCVPLVHTAHTLALVKNAALTTGDRPEPATRVRGEEQVVAAADLLVANTDEEATSLVDGYRAEPAKVRVVQPGVDLTVFVPPADEDQRLTERAEFGLPADRAVLSFVGRFQPLKGPDVLLRAVGRLVRDAPSWADRLVVVLCGGASGTAGQTPEELAALAAEEGIEPLVRFLPPQPPARLAALYRASDVLAVPSHHESFGLVALEAQACGTPVVAAAIGGLVTAVDDGVSGCLVAGHAAGDWAEALARVLGDERSRAKLSAGAVRHARGFGWDSTVSGLLTAYGQMAPGGRTMTGPAW